MLDIDDCRSIVDDIWATATQRTELPEEWADFFELKGPTPIVFDNERRHHRYYLRSKAIVVSGETQLAGYTKDVSRIGMDVYTPIQLFPRQVVRVWLPEGKDYLTRITRCVRIGEKCYECGTQFLRVTDLQSQDAPLTELIR